MNELNAIRAANNLPPIQMATRVTNQEVDGAFGDVDALWFSYHLFDYGKQRQGYWDGEKMVLQTKEIISMFEYKFPGRISGKVFGLTMFLLRQLQDLYTLGNRALCLWLQRWRFNC